MHLLALLSSFGSLSSWFERVCVRNLVSNVASWAGQGAHGLDMEQGKAKFGPARTQQAEKKRKAENKRITSTLKRGVEYLEIEKKKSYLPPEL